jgi:hypothetical protein
MIITVDLRTIPSVLARHPANDLGTFSVRINTPDHMLVDRDAVIRPIGNRAIEPGWSGGLEEWQS